MPYQNIDGRTTAPLAAVITYLGNQNISIVSEPRTVATGSGSPARFFEVPPDPVATALGSDTEVTPFSSG